MPDWRAVRAEFPALATCTFLNTATFGQTPRTAVAAIHRHLAERDETACANFLSWYTDHDRLREKLAQLVNAEAADIAFLQNAAQGMAQLMHGIEWREGDEVLTLRDEFPIQLYAPQARGLVFVEAPWPELLQRVSVRTRLIAVSMMNYSTGFVTPLEELAAAARRVGALLYIDGTQGLGALTFDFARIQPDMLCVHTYKWMLTPNGAAFIAVHPRLRAQMRPLTVGWRSHHDWRNVNNLHHGAPEFVESAEKYEGGMLPSALLYALEAVVDLMLELGPAAIEQRALELSAQARCILEAKGATVAHPNSPIVAARFPDREAGALALQLKQQGILAAARHGHLRISTHFYNNEHDLERLDAAL